MKAYSVVTFGCPRRRLQRYYLNEDRAIAAAQDAMGTGTCSNARVYECDSIALAKSADISEIRDGERVIFHA